MGWNYVFHKWKHPDLSRTVMHGPHAWLAFPGYIPGHTSQSGCLTWMQANFAREKEKNLVVAMVNSVLNVVVTAVLM